MALEHQNTSIKNCYVALLLHATHETSCSQWTEDFSVKGQTLKCLACICDLGVSEGFFNKTPKLLAMKKMDNRYAIMIKNFCLSKDTIK